MTVPQPPFRVRTIYSWSGVEEDDLGFIEGDIIEVDSLGDGNWWHGRLKRNKMKGMFPSNYVELIKSDLPGFTSSMRESVSPSPSPERKLKVDTSLKNSEEELAFSFQSSTNYYSDLSHSKQSPHYASTQGNYSPKSPYNYENQRDSQRPAQRQTQLRHQQQQQAHHQIIHSKSYPAKLEVQDQVQRRVIQEQHELRYEASREHYQSQPNLSAPNPPQHSIPFTKSKSSFNLGATRPDASRPVSPFTSSRNEYDTRLQKQTTRGNNGSSEFVAPYDPESLTQSRSTASKNSNVFTYSNGSYFSSSQSSNNSSMALSDFSATSAGSYSRHKYENSQNQRENANERFNGSSSGNNVLVNEKKVKSVGAGILKKFFQPKEAPPLPKVELLNKASGSSQEDNQINSWIDFKIDLNRANSLSTKERQLREKRVRENEGYIIFEPHKQLSKINNNEVLQTDHKLDLTVINLTHVDNYVRNLKGSSSPQVMSPEDFITNDLGMKYSSKLEYIRALFVLCTEHFQIVENDKSQELKKPNIDEIFKSKKADTFGIANLFTYLANSMGLKCEFIVGSLKTPQSIIRHYWNSILINGEWRFVDVSLGNLTNPIHEFILPDPANHEELNESFYFLTEPLNLIHTHIPDRFEEQHIVPPIDPMAALALPPCFPSFFKNGLKLHKFNNALTKLLDFEIFEIDLKVPKDIEINAMVLTKNSITNSLAQIYWKHNERYCKIKGHLPNNQMIGFINVYSGLKGSQKSLTNIHPLSLVIPITHDGQYKPLEFVTRYPTFPAQNNDLYIKQPQNKNLKCGTNYAFNILQHPSQGLSSIPSSLSKLKIALQSPSGKIVKLEKKDPTVPFGSWELLLKCNEIGVWRGLVSVDNGTSLCVFAEWACV